MDERPRITAEEASARFEALVQQHRRARRPRGPRWSALPRSGGPVAFALVYLIGVAAGVASHAKPAAAVLLGLPLMLLARTVLSRLRPDAGGKD